MGFFSAHRQSLYKYFLPALKLIDFDIKLKIIGITKKKHIDELNLYFSGFKNIALDLTQEINWLDEFEIYKHIRYFDVGISTLMDNELDLAKSAFKLKQYLSCGVPVLATSNGENKYFLNNGYNGFFCDSPSEFYKMIIYLNDLDE